MCTYVLLACKSTMCMQFLRRPEEGTNPLGLKLEVVSSVIWVLGTKPGSSKNKCS